MIYRRFVWPPRRVPCPWCRRRFRHDLACESARLAALWLARRDFEVWETELGERQP